MESKLLARRVVFAGILSLFALTSKAQIIRIDSTSNWKESFKAGLNFNQASFSDNWKGGGTNAIGFNTLLNYRANFRKGRNIWDNELDFFYGLVNNAGSGFRKTNDRLYIDTKYGYALTPKWDLTAALNVLTQFARGYSYKTNSAGIEIDSLISDFFAPGFVTAALGAEYHPVPFFKVRVSPIAPRATIVKGVERFVTPSNPTPFGVTPPDHVRLEWFGAQILAEFDKDLMKNVNLKFRYLMFANYEQLESKRIDHRLDLNLTGKVNQFINVNLNGILIYDYDQDGKVQFSEALSLGFLYWIQNFEEKN